MSDEREEHWTRYQLVVMAFTCYVMAKENLSDADAMTRVAIICAVTLESFGVTHLDGMSPEAVASVASMIELMRFDGKPN